MTAYVIRLVQDVGIRHAGAADIPPGAYLEDWDVEFRGGIGAAWWTSDPAKAYRFPDQVAAMNAYREQSRTRPVRPDGRPNRPLAAYTVEVVAAPVRP